MSILNRRASSYPNFIGAVTRAMLLVMESGDGYFDGNVTYDSEKRTFEVNGCDIDAFREYIEALVTDGVPALRADAANQVEGKSDNHIELLAVLREIDRKLDWMPCFDTPIVISWHIRLHAQRSLAISFEAKAIVDDEVAYGFSTSAGFPL